MKKRLSFQAFTRDPILTIKNPSFTSIFIITLLFLVTTDSFSARVEVTGGGGGTVSDTVYGAGWDGDTTVAPSKNAVYDKIETIASGGDNITVNTTGATNANFLDNLYIDIAIDTAATPDDITWKFNYAETLAGNPALLTTECIFMADGLMCEGTTADTIEIKLAFPDPATTDKTITLPNATDTLVGKDTTDTLTNKTLAAASNVIDADTAVALAADPSDCATSTHFAVGVIASGAATCEAIGDADIPDSTTVTGWVLGTSSATQITSPTVIVDLLDASGAVDMDYGSADVTDHTFTTDGTGDSEVVLPADSIGPAEIDSTTGAYDFGSVTSFEIPNTTADVALSVAGQVSFNTTDEQLSFHSAADGEISGEASISLIRHLTATFDPAGWYDQESTYRVVPLMTVGDDSPEGITITEWEVDYVGGNPTTELDADIICDTTPDYNPAAGATVMDVIDTTTGASSADTGFDSATCANASKMYIRFGADPTDANVVIQFDLWFYNEED